MLAGATESTPFKHSPGPCGGSFLETDLSLVTRANQGLFIAIVALLAFAPVPVASNRPFFWAINAMIVSGLTIAYLAALGGKPSRLRIPLNAMGAASFLFLATIVWMVIQIIPLPQSIASLPVWDEASNSLRADLPHTISVDPAATIGMIIRFVTYGLLFFLALQATANPSRARWMITAIFAITLIHAALAIAMLLEFGDVLLLFPKWAYQGYATGFFVNRNSFATFTAFGIVAGTVLSLDAYGPWRRSGEGARLGIEAFWLLLVYGAGLAVLATAIALSASRMGAFVAVVGVLSAFSLALLRSPGRRGRIFVGLVALVVVGLIIFAISGAGLADRVGSLETGADDRLLLYQQVIEMIRERPWTGYGGGTFSAVFPVFHHLPLSADVTWDAAHNLYLELFSDLGFGAFALLAAALIVFVRMFRGLSQPGVDWVAPAASVAMMIVAAVHSLVDFSLQIEANALVFVCAIAAGTAQVWIGPRTTAAPTSPS